MTPKEKAKYLFDKYHKELWDNGETISKPMLKQCCLIAVDEIIGAVKNSVKRKSPSLIPKIVCEQYDYWQKVKEEINQQ